MPQIKLKHIVSFSSEDFAHPADNLLKCETYRKWQCADSTEKQVSVVIELEKASKIHSIDVGNNGSAFVEVLAGRSSSELPHDFQVLLVSSSFMSPAESKSGMNSNRVRMFGPEKLSKTTADQKWDRIKFICTQPYNKTSCYGLSFVNLHSPPESHDKGQPEKVQSRLGAFILKDEGAVDAITSGSLFLKRKEKTETPPPKSTAAELREASKNPEIHTVQTALIKQENKDVTKETVVVPKRKIESSPSNKDMDVPRLTKFSSLDKLAHPPLKKIKVLESAERAVPLHEILKNVVFVLSGFKNPERGHLRDKALSMGARYRGDWDISCTHLICAFAKTPKYNQVEASGKGMIVTKSWINDCHKRKKRLPEKRYKLNGDSSDDSDSSTEDEEIQSRHSDVARQHSTVSASATVSTTHESNKDECKERKVVDESREIDNAERICAPNDDESSSGHDTEDEIRRVMEDKEDPYGVSTECETDEEDEKDEKGIKDKVETTNPQPSSRGNLLELPELFSKMIFFLHGEFDQDERRTLTRYITAYDGELEEYMSGNVKYVITNENWDDNFNEALIDNSSLTFVMPKWIYACHEKRSIVPYQPYIVVPR